MANLRELELSVQTSLSYLGGLPEPWVPKQAGIDHDVLVVGAGQNGIAAAFALRRQGVLADVIDSEAEGDEGVWIRRARMRTLRTSKDKPGPELGIPALTFQAWYTALHGADAYDQIERIPRTVWAEYLAWYRQVLNIPVRYQTRLIDIKPDGLNLRVTLECRGRRSTEVTRKLVLASGLAGTGASYVPEVIVNGLPRSHYAHTDNIIDFPELRGKDIGIVGASASGFDAAAVAVESGARSVNLFCRAPDLAKGVRFRWADYPGADYFYLLPDPVRWQITRLYMERGNHPPPASIARAAALGNFTLHLGAPWQSASLEGQRAAVEVKGDRFTFDFIIAATGFRHDPTLCPELSSISSDVALWEDRFSPPPDQRDPILGRYPYLGASFEFMEKRRGDAPFLRNIHVLNVSALPSFLRIVGDIKCLGFTSQRLASAIVRDLFLADTDRHLDRLSSPIIPELTGAEYESLVYKKQREMSSA